MNSSFSPFPQKILVAALSTALTMAFSPDANAQSSIAMDGTTGAGAGANQDFSGIAGANQTIIIEGGGANANGSVKGANLFFSFDKLGVAQGDTAHIQCAGGQCGTGSDATGQVNIANVITRVTGSNPSEINGTLKSTVGNANVWVFNPKGVAIGAGAQVDVPAALHISTANQLKDTNGNTMWAADNKNSTLSAATPDSFGFDAASTGDINITDATISVGNGASEISSANNVDIINSQLPAQKANTAGTLKIGAQGKITVDATSELTADITAGTDINNSGIIHGNATTERINPQGQTVAGNFDSELNNTGHIDGDATVKIINNGIINGSTTAIISGNGIVAGNTNASITNSTSGSIQSDAKASTDIINNGIINGDAEATTGTLTNTNTVNGNALAGTDLVNDISGVIGKNTTAKNGAISNRGTIGFTPPPIGTTFNATAGTTLNNSATGIINGNAKASADIINNGVITGDVEVTTGSLTNNNIINGNSLAGTHLINNASGIIGKNATANRKLDNSGTIRGNATTEYINPQGTTVNGDVNSELINTGTIEGSAAVNITNDGTISGSAIADVNTGISGGGTIKGIKTARIINSSSGIIQGDAKATTNIVNNGMINGDAYTTTKIDNSGVIHGNAIMERINPKNVTVNGDFNNELINTGVIGGNALVTIINDGTINGSASAIISGSGIVNGNKNASIINSASGVIKVNAKASNDINNSGIMTGNAEATTGILTNSKLIEGNATGASLDNKGIIYGDAIASAGSLTNSNLIAGNAIATDKLDNNGTIEKNAIVTNGHLLNNSAGVIKKNATAKTDINNYGIIHGNAEAVTGTLANYQSIAGNAAAGTDIINNIGGTINNGAIAGVDLINYAVINGEAVYAGRDLINTGLTANINLNKSSGEVSAKRDLSVNEGSKIIFSNSGTALAIAGGAFTISNAANVTALNSGEFYALAGGNLTVNTGGKLTANNTGHYAATISAGTALNNTGQLTATATGGSLLVQQGGIIEKNTGAGDLTLVAHASSENGSVPNRQSSGGQLAVEGNGSAINVGINHTGNLIIYPDALVAEKNLNRNNQFIDVNNKEQYALRVSDGGVINKNNSGNMEVTAQTVYLEGLNAIFGGTNGDINFNSVVKADAINNARLPRYFKMRDATMTNLGAVNISDFFLNLDRAGIKSDTSITLNVFNSADIVYPKVLIGYNSSIVGLKTGKNFLDAPSNSKILVNNRISLNPEDNIGTLTRDISAAMVVSNAIPELPDNPCDSHTQSTLNSKGVANYIPDVSSQAPYSVVTTATDAVSVSSAKSAAVLTGLDVLECG